MRNVRLLDRRKRKFTCVYKQFRVTKVIGNNVYQLDMLKGIHNVFNTSLMRPVAQDPFPS